MLQPDVSLRRYLHTDLGHLKSLRRREVSQDILDEDIPSSIDLGDGSQLLLTKDAEEALRFIPIDLPDTWAREKPLSIAFDPSSSMSIVGRRGNMRVLLIKPLAVAAEGNVGAVASRFQEQRLFVTLASDREFEAPAEMKDTVLFNHFALQAEQQNALKHLKECAVLVGPLEECVRELSRYQYRYRSGPAERKVIIMRDGSILSNSESIVAEYLPKKGPVRGPVFDRMWLYHVLKTASEEYGIPIVGVTKDAQADILARFFSRPVYDYSILRALARRQDVQFGVLPPIRRVWPKSSLSIDYYFVFLEHGVSCLRIDVLSSSVLKDSSWDNVAHDVVRLAIENLETIETNNTRYRLPYALAKADQLTRVRSQELYQYANETAKALSPDLGIKVVSERA